MIKPMWQDFLIREGRLAVKQIIYIATVLACASPVSMSCQPLIKPEAFYDRAVCEAEVQEMRELLTRKGVLNIGECVEIKVVTNL